MLIIYNQLRKDGLFFNAKMHSAKGQKLKCQSKWLYIRNDKQVSVDSKGQCLFFFPNQRFILASWLFYVSMDIYYTINVWIDLSPFH
jgi:hypothetical protein